MLFLVAVLPFASIALASQHVFADVLNLPPHAKRNRTCSIDEEVFFVRDPVCLPKPENVVTKPTPSTPSPAGDPWTQPPACIHTFNNESDLFCIYTSATFANGRGISIFSTPDIAQHLAQSPAFTNPSVPEGVNVESNPPYTVQSLPGRGMGVIANRTLHKGDSIFSYTPVLIINRKSFEVFNEDDRFPFQRDAVDRLPQRARELFLGLHGHFGGDKVDDIVSTNSFQVDLGPDEEEESHNIILPETSRMNHDCRPNAHYYFDVDTLTHHVNAIQTIHAGEEITISYTDGSASREERQAAIKLSWGFDCNCSLCTQRETLTRESDRRLALIAEFEKHLEDWTDESPATPEMAETVVSLYEQERLHAPIAMAYTHAALAHSAVGNAMQAIKWAALAVEVGTLNSGPEFEDVQAMKELFDDPQEHWSWNLRRRKPVRRSL